MLWYLNHWPLPPRLIFNWKAWPQFWWVPINLVVSFLSSDWFCLVNADCQSQIHNRGINIEIKSTYVFLLFSVNLPKNINLYIHTYIFIYRHRYTFENVCVCALILQSCMFIHHVITWKPIFYLDFDLSGIKVILRRIQL